MSTINNYSRLLYKEKNYHKRHQKLTVNCERGIDCLVSCLVSQPVLDHFFCVLCINIK